MPSTRVVLPSIELVSHLTGEVRANVHVGVGTNLFDFSSESVSSRCGIESISSSISSSCTALSGCNSVVLCAHLPRVSFFTRAKSLALERSALFYYFHALR